MQITDAEKQQMERIINKTKQIEKIDPKCEMFGAKAWSYKWPKVASPKQLEEFEKKHQIVLPREYRLFLGHIANGGPGFAYGIYPLEKTEIMGNIKKESTCFPFMTYDDFKAIEERQQAIYDTDENSEEDLFYDGLLAIATEGCTYDICLVVTGEHHGRLVKTDGNKGGPFYFIYDENFLDWYERWLDDFIADMDMYDFGWSVPGTQSELRRRFFSEENPKIKTDIVSSLARFPSVETETMTFWEDACKTESSAIAYISLWGLIHNKAPATPAIIQELLDLPDGKREVCIRLLRFASQHGVDINPFIPKLLKIMPTLSDDLFSNAIWAVQETSFNKYETFLPFFALNEQKKQAVLWALENTPNEDNKDFANRLLQFFVNEYI